jgi:hypothetical protein
VNVNGKSEGFCISEMPLKSGTEGSNSLDLNFEGELAKAQRLRIVSGRLE